MQLNLETKEDQLQYFKEFLHSYSEHMREYVNRVMVDDGNTGEESQRIYILNAINNLDMAIAGTDVEDIKTNEDSE